MQIYNYAISPYDEWHAQAWAVTCLLFVAKHLERVGDYVTDICELTVYMTEAAVIRHSN